MTNTQAQNYKTAQDHVTVYADEIERLSNEITRLGVLLDRMADEGATDSERMAVAAQGEMLIVQRDSLRPRLNEWLNEVARWDNGW